VRYKQVVRSRLLSTRFSSNMSFSLSLKSLHCDHHLHLPCWCR